LIAHVTLPLNAGLKLERISRTPADVSILCVAMAKWPGGRTRLALGGLWACPRLALDGQDESGAAAAAKNACSHEGNQNSSSQEYLEEMAEILTGRILRDSPASNR
jgi:hypothetical protein